MDKKIEKKRFGKKTIMAGVAVLVFITLLGYVYRLSTKKVFRVDADKITVNEVLYGDFEDVILQSANVEPLTSVIVSSSEGGVVETIYAENGAFVQKGTPLLKIANPHALQGYTSTETAITEQMNQLRKVRLDLEQNQRKLKEDLIEVGYNLGKTERQYKIDTNLYAKGVISANEFRKSSQDFNYYRSKRNLLKEAIAQENQSRGIQLKQIDLSTSQMQENLAIIHQNIENMTVKAPIAGRLSSFDPIVGKNYASNEMLGKIDVMQGYKLQASIDEYYISRVKEGQTAECEFNGSTYELVVKRVIPEVIKGQFQIELVFSKKAPENLRRGLSLQVKLILSNSNKSLLLAQGQFFQSTGGSWVFVSKNNKAVKRNVRIGRKNNRYYEVLDGLQKGEQVITSSYEQFTQYDEVEISK